MSLGSYNSRPSGELKSRPPKWSGAVKIFHWGSVLLLIMTWAMMAIHKNTDGSTFIELHKAFGVSLLLWMIARVISRIISQSPPSMPMPKWQTILSHITHLVLYLLLLAMPLSGLLMTWYGGRSIDMFGLFELPSMFNIDRSQARFFNDLHVDIIWPAILVFTAVHILGALHHQFIKKDNIFSRIK